MVARIAVHLQNPVHEALKQGLELGSLYCIYWRRDWCNKAPNADEARPFGTCIVLS